MGVDDSVETNQSAVRSKVQGKSSVLVDETIVGDSVGVPETTRTLGRVGATTPGNRVTAVGNSRQTYLDPQGFVAGSTPQSGIEARDTFSTQRTGK